MSPTAENFPSSDVAQESLTPRTTQLLGGLAAEYCDWAAEHPYQATCVETVGVLAGRLAVRKLGERLGLNLGNALSSNEEEIREVARHPLAYGVAQIIAAPVLEEFGCRVVPDEIAATLKAKGRPGAAIAVRNTADVLFAAWHAGLARPSLNVASRRLSVRTWRSGDKLSLPLSPYLAGRNLRRIYEQRGVKAAVVSHSLNNALNFGIGALSYVHRKK